MGGTIIYWLWNERGRNGSGTGHPGNPGIPRYQKGPRPGSLRLHGSSGPDKPVLPFRHEDLEPCTFPKGPGLSHRKTGYGEYFPGQE